MIRECSTSKHVLYLDIIASLENLGFKEIQKNKWFKKGENRDATYTLIKDLYGYNFNLESKKGYLTFTAKQYDLTVTIIKSLTGIMVEIR